MTKQKILIVDDDRNISQLIALYMAKECFETMCVAAGRDVLPAFFSFHPDLILLDIMLPGMDGYQVCRQLRTQSNVPIIFLSAKDEVFDKVLGLELGADDYLAKPFDNKEMVARVKAVLRRSQPVPAQQPENDKVVSVPYLTVNLTNYTVTFRGQTVAMPPKELELLYQLASCPNRVFTREQLLESIWAYDYDGGSRTVDVHMRRLREKLPDNDAWRLSTVWGKGYRFEMMPIEQ